MHGRCAKRIGSETAPNFMLLPPFCRRTARDLAHDGYCDLCRRYRIDIESDRRMNTRDVRLAQTCLFEAIDALGMRFFGAECTNIEAVTGQCMLECRIVNFRIVGQRHKRGIVVNAERRQRHVRPLCDHFHIRKPFDRRKSRPRIDNGDVITQQLPDGRQRLADVHSTGNDKPRRWHVNGQEKPSLRRLFHAAFGQRRRFTKVSFKGSLATSEAFTSRCEPLATSVTSTAARRAARSALRACRTSRFTQLTFST